MRKIFLDCGAHDGCSVRAFRKHRKDANDFEIFCFEPNPNLAKYHPIENTTFIPKAVWIENGHKTFYVFGTEGGSTILKNKAEQIQQKPKKKYDKNYPQVISVKTETIDISLWIEQNFSEDDYIILKLDIEGAEYDIFNKMIKEKTFRFINEIYCEFHNTRCGKSVSTDNKIKEQLLAFDLKPLPWDAMHPEFLYEHNCSEYRRKAV